MTDTTAFTDLGLTDVSANDSGCSCCAVSERSSEVAGAAASGDDAAPGDRNPEQLSIWKVDGMTCGHCISSVTEQLSAIDGVTGVDVALMAGGVSTVTVRSARVLDEPSVAAAVDEAGYRLV
ncbi:heavy-metal-associated domain-containing protein [Luethyella okanaganae]|uniref:Heavy-metal-associated domain-containing protein n=1 Tax=Luethyella okanaganae TaxID=69372 RepID=A0ABW1VEW3_9MICO